jgi:hypothetical protein
MQRICRLICKICRICKQICTKICTKYDIKYATNMQNMQKNMQNMSYQKTFQVYPKICKICKKYAKYVSQNVICRICTPHFADEHGRQGTPYALVPLLQINLNHHTPIYQAQGVLIPKGLCRHSSS